MSEWKQQFEPPNQKRDCIHGSLARSCRICELEHEVFDLKRDLQGAIKAIDAIEAIVSDDFCQELEMQTNTGAMATLADKISAIYRIAHSESPSHPCHHVHAEWRKIKDEVLKDVTSANSLPPSTASTPPAQ